MKVSKAPPIEGKETAPDLGFTFGNLDFKFAELSFTVPDLPPIDFVDIAVFRPAIKNDDAPSDEPARRRQVEVMAAHGVPQEDIARAHDHGLPDYDPELVDHHLGPRDRHRPLSAGQ
jgi:hypothetical protein